MPDTANTADKPKSEAEKHPDIAIVRFCGEMSGCRQFSLMELMCD